MSDSEDMTEFGNIVERIERGEVGVIIRMICGPSDSSGLSVREQPAAEARGRQQAARRAAHIILLYSLISSL